MADINRSELATLIQDGYANDFLAHTYKTSVALSAFPTRNLGTKTTNLPVLSTKPHAGWVAESSSGATGVKPTGQATWANKTLVVEELAVIVPIHENVIDDATVDVVSEITRQGAEAIAFALDAAVLFGWQKPLSWVSNDLYASAVAASNVFTVDAAAGADDLAGGLLQGAESLSEYYDPTDILARRGLRYRLANLRDTDGSPIFMASMSNTPGANDQIHGLNAHWVSGSVDDGASGDKLVWDPAVAEALIVDSSRVIIGVRQDITVKYLDQATVGSINLAERDMVALRFKARFAYALGDNIASGVATSTNSPVSVVIPAGS